MDEGRPNCFEAFCENAADFGSAIQATSLVSPWNVTYVADLVGRRLDELDEVVTPGRLSRQLVYTRADGDLFFAMRSVRREPAQA